MATARHWSAFHVFLADPERANDFLLEWLKPRLPTLLSEGRIAGWFFVRYWEGGPHLRLRLLDADPALCIEFAHALQNAVPAYLSGFSLSARQYYANHPLDGEPRPLESLPWYPEGSVVQLPYEPEIRRYGGPAAIAHCEQLFKRSSEIALAVLGATRGDPQRRAAVAWRLMAEAVFAFEASPSALVAFCASYAGFWRGYSAETRALDERLAAQTAPAAQVQALRRMLEECIDGARADSAQARWAEACAGLDRRFGALHAQQRLVSPLTGEVCEGEEALRAARFSILSSQIHMLNNRLGLQPAQELALARSLAAAAGAVGEGIAA